MIKKKVKIEAIEKEVKNFNRVIAGLAAGNEKNWGTEKSVVNEGNRGWNSKFRSKKIRILRAKKQKKLKLILAEKNCRMEETKRLRQKSHRL